MGAPEEAVAEPAGLRPCPFCRGVRFKHYTKNEDVVQCLTCWATAQSEGHPDGAIAAWNRRPLPEEEPASRLASADLALVKCARLALEDAARLLAVGSMSPVKAERCRCSARQLAELVERLKP